MIFRSIVSGSSGNSVFFSDGSTNILIDCGISGKKITAYLNDMGVLAQDINAVFVTHEHSDHTTGVGALARKYGLPVYASAGTWEGMDIGRIAGDKAFAFYKNEPISVGSLKVTPFDIPHDAAQPTGYVIESAGERYAVATDIGYASESVLNALCGCKAVVLEANYDEQMLLNGSYPAQLKKRIWGERGHMDNKVAGELAIKLAQSGTKHIMLGHLSNDNNSPDIAFAEVARSLELGGISVGKDILLSVAPRYSASENLCK